MHSNLVIVVNSFFNLIINLAIYLIYFNIDAQKPLSGTLNKVYVCMYVCLHSNLKFNEYAWKIVRFFIIKQIKKPRLCSVLL